MTLDLDPFLADLFPWDFSLRVGSVNHPVRPLRVGDALALERLAGLARDLGDSAALIERARAAAAAGAAAPPELAGFDAATAAFESSLRAFVGGLVPDASPPAPQWPVPVLRKAVDELVAYWNAHAKKNTQLRHRMQASPNVAGTTERD